MEEVDVNEVVLGQLWASRVPDEGRPFMLCNDSFVGGVARYDVVA